MNPETILREVFEEQAAAVPAPVGLYAGIRRRHVRRQRLLIAGTVVVVLAAVGLPAALLGSRGAAPTPLTAAASTAYAPATPAPAPIDLARCPRTPRVVTQVPAQHDVRGALGGDPDLVRDVAKAGWGLVAGGKPAVDLATLRVHMVDRTPDGLLAALVTLTGSNAAIQESMIVGGPDLGHLAVIGGGGVRAAGRPATPFDTGPAFVGTVSTVCGVHRAVGVVVADPGTTGQLRWVASIDADTEVTTRIAAMPLRPDGVGLVQVPTANTKLTLVRDGRQVYGDVIHLGWILGSAPSPEDVQRAASTGPGDGPLLLIARFLGSDVAQLPFPTGDLRRLWSLTLGGGEAVAVLGSVTLPNGVLYVWAGTADTAGHVDVRFRGYAPAGALAHTVFTWQIDHGERAAVTAATGVRVDIHGGTYKISASGQLIVSGTARATDAAGRPMSVLDVRDLVPVTE